MTTEESLIAQHRVELTLNYELLRDAVQLTHDWRERVYDHTGVRPPTAYHRILLYLWVHNYNGQDAILKDRLAEECGFNPQTLRQILYRMSCDGLLYISRDPDVPSGRRVSLTEHGMLIAEV